MTGSGQGWGTRWQTSLAARDALGLFPTGIVIVTTRDQGGEPIGMTINSFSSVSLSPPLVLFSIGSNAYSFDDWCCAENYAISVLSEDQTKLSSRFARALEDKWTGVDIDTGVTGVPLISGALVQFECANYARYDGGDHDIFLARVLAIHDRQRQANTHRPAIFFQGAYRRLDPEVAFPTPQDEASLLHGW